VFRRHPHGVPFAHVVDMFFVANAPWLLWLIAFSLFRAFESPIRAATLTTPSERGILATLLPTVAWSAWIDLHFFRTVLPRPAGAGRDLLIEHAIACSPSTSTRTARRGAMAA
jgi:hypothetical protein